MEADYKPSKLRTFYLNMVLKIKVKWVLFKERSWQFFHPNIRRNDGIEFKK